MIEKIKYIHAQSVNPYENLALEEYILQNVKENEVIMYLWQNAKTVVIGRNQNCRAQCKLEKLRADGGFLARRLSGGGAVFHDLGNLNFTFVAHEDNYNVLRQTQVILNAVLSFGINAQRTGRNDIEADGRKFSGNAFYKSRNKQLHHGTLLLCTNMAKLSDYLTVSSEKLKGHGVKSVSARVVNLCDLSPDITVESMKTALVNSFSDVYNIKAENMAADSLNNAQISELTQKYKSDEWRLGMQADFSYTIARRFEWGEAELCFNVSGTKLENCTFYTDALDENIAQIVQSAINGCEFKKQVIIKSLLSENQKHDEITKAMLNDIAMLINEEIL